MIEITGEEARGPAARQIPGARRDDESGVWSFDPTADEHAAAIAAALFPELREQLRPWLPDPALPDAPDEPRPVRAEAASGRSIGPAREPATRAEPRRPPTRSTTRSRRRDRLTWWMLGVGFVLVLCVTAWRPWAAEPLCTNHRAPAQDSGYPCRIEHSNGRIEHLFIDDATGAVRSASTAPSGGPDPFAIGAGLSAAALLILGGAYVRLGRDQSS